MGNMRGEWLRVDAENVLAETIDNEVMIIDMRLGNYFSLFGPAVTIWDALLEPARLEDVIEAVCCQYDGVRGEIAAAVERFVDDLLRERLVAVAPPNGAHVAPPPSPAAEKPPFEPPVLEKYTDMQALLLVDPIHDVDVLGWPRVKPS